MKTEVKKLDKLKRNIKIEVEGKEFLDKKNEIYRNSSKKLKVPGFRPGTAPVEIIEKHHGKILKDELVKEVVPLFYGKALEKEKITPASMPKIDNVKCTRESLTFSAEFEIKPVFEIKESVYKGIKIKDKKIEVKQAEIEKVLTNLKDGIKKVSEKDLSEEELAKWAAYPDIDALKSAIKIQLSGEKLKERRQNVDGQVREVLLKANKIDVPKSEIEHYETELLNRELHNLRTKGIPQADLDKYKKELQEKIKPIAVNEVKLYYIFEAIAKKENIKIDNALAEVVSGYILSQAQY